MMDVTVDHAAAPAVRLERVSLRLGRANVLQDVTFSIARGTVCGLLAPSGGGKTSVLRLLTGFYAPSSGSVCVLGRAPAQFSLAERRRIGYMPQQFILYPELSVWRNLAFVAGIYGLPRARRDERIDALLGMVDLEAARDRPAGRLSGGMQRRLELAATLLHQPDLLIIDEPTAGIDPILRARFWEQFRELRDSGQTLVVSTQYVTEAEHCDQVVVLRDGTVIADGSPVALRERAFPEYQPVAGTPAPSFEAVFLRLMAAAQQADAPEIGMP